MDETKTVSAKPSPKSGFRRFGPAFRHSVVGLRATFKTEAAFQQEILGFLILVPVALWLGESNTERVLLIGPLFLVLIVELLNSAVESAVDRWGNDYNEFTKAAKDAGSAAVFISLLLVVFVWVMLLVIPVVL